MPLDTSIYALSNLRLDGRRWNELRRIHAQISTQAAADGSSYLEMGNTKVICTISGPAEVRGRGGGGGGEEGATVVVDICVAGFSAVDRKRRGRGDKYVFLGSFTDGRYFGEQDRLIQRYRRMLEMSSTISSAFQSTLFTHLYPRSTITLTISVLSQDGSLLAACLNASTLALIDAGIPMSDYIVACTSGSISSYTSSRPDDETADPLLDLNGQEELELPFLTVGTLGAGEKVSVCVMESKVRAERLEGMLAVGVDGCKRVREILDGVVRSRGNKILGSVIN